MTQRAANFNMSNMCADGLNMPRDTPAFRSPSGTDQKWPVFVVWPEKQATTCQNPSGDILSETSR